MPTGVNDEQPLQFQVLVPRLQWVDDECRRQDVEVVIHDLVRDAERTGEFRSIPDVALVMREHGPEAAEDRGWCADAKLRQVAFQKGLDEVAPPLVAGRKRGGRGIRPALYLEIWEIKSQFSR